MNEYEINGRKIRVNFSNSSHLETLANQLGMDLGTKDEKIRAFDKETGKILWEAKLPAAGHATPAVYEKDGKQFLVIACGGGKGTKSGDVYVAFALPN